MRCLIMYVIKIFAHNVRKYRTLIVLSHEILAEKIVLHKTYISTVERKRLHT